MSADRPEFSRIVPLAQLGTEPFRQEIAATESEREALARRFGLLALDRLTAEVDLVRQGQDTILLRASFVVSARCCFIIVLLIASGQLRGFALLRKAAISCAFAFHAANARVSDVLSPAFAASMLSNVRIS